MFKASNPFDEDVTAATSETLTKEDWELITTICERADKGGEQSARECVAAIQKRLLHRNPNVQGYALTLSNALVRMCGINVHKEISSRTFTQTLTRILQDKSTHETVKNRILDLIQEWSNVFRSDDTLGLMEETMNHLRSQNFQFPSPEKPKKELTEYEIEKQKKEEEEQIQMAMALSLSSAEVDAKRKISSTTTTTNTATSTLSQPVSQNKDLSHTPSVSRVKALYDFVPTESGELGFSRGDVITVLDSVYKDWWRGELRGKTGIFPVNYVEKLPEPTAADIAREAEMEAAIFAEGRNIEQLLELLAGLDPTSDSVTENEHIQNLYNRTLPVRPKLMKLIEKYSQRKDDLIALHKKFIQAITTYDRLMAESLRKYEAYMNPTPQHQFNYPSATPSFIPPASGHGYFNPQQHFQQINQQSQPEKPSYQVQPQYPQQQYPPQDVVGQLNAYQQANQQANQQPPVQPQQDNVNQQPLNYPAQQAQQTPLYPQVQQEVVGQIAAYQQQQASQQPQQIPAVQPTSQFSSSDNVGNQMISSFATPTPTLDNTLNSGSTNYNQEPQQQLYPPQNTQESSNQQSGYYQPSIYSNQQTQQPSSQPPIQQPSIQQPPIQQPPIQQSQQNQTGQTNYPPNSQSQFQTPFSGQYLPVDGPGSYQIQPSTSPQPEINTGGQPSVNYNAYSNTPPPNSNSSNSSYSFNDASYQPTTAQQPQRQATLPPHVQHQQPISLAQIVQHVNPSATQQQQQYPQQNYYNPSQGAPASYGASVVKSEFVQ